MENHVYKHHFRHGHHHHKHDMFYGLLAMVFFAAIALGVVASIYYTFIPSKQNIQQMAENAIPVDDSNYRCLPGYPECNDTPNYNPTSGTCLVGTVDCNDTLGMYGEQSGSNGVFVPVSQNVTKYNNSFGYSVLIPAGMGVFGDSEDAVVVKFSNAELPININVSDNTAGLNLQQAFDESADVLAPDSNIVEYQPYLRELSNLKIDGINARKVFYQSQDGFQAILYVVVNNERIYTIYTYSSDENLEGTELNNIIETLEFIE